MVSKEVIMTHISEREQELPDAVIGEIFRLTAEDKSIISLGPGQPDFPTPRPILDECKRAIYKATRYSSPGGVIELREALVKKLRKENNIKLGPENIIVTTGSQEAIFTAMLCTLDPAEEIIVPNPGYLAYIPAANLIHAVPVPLKLNEEDGFEVNPDELRKLINKKRTKVILINSPANPTGNVLKKRTLEEIAGIAREHDLYIFSDEAYERLTYGTKHVSIGSLNGMGDHVITFQTFSKTFSMCGFRVGYCAGPKKLMQAIEKAHHYLTLAAPHISQLLAIKALTIKKSYIEKMRKEYERRRNFLVERLNEIGLRTTLPKGAFYTFSNISEFSKDSTRFARDLLKKSRVAVIPGVEFGKFGEGYIRCSYATAYPMLEKATARIEKYLKKYDKSLRS
ncbi:pyridoxal phosphate-dependent aminotransferase [Candidatus Woesearchaeota archaeon]|nr:pyridoxal phosphate-dependent aminotransferase [Candidatus Woesearchaeota archaeon]